MKTFSLLIDHNRDASFHNCLVSSRKKKTLAKHGIGKCHRLVVDPNVDLLERICQQDKGCLHSHAPEIVALASLKDSPHFPGAVQDGFLPRWQ